MDTTAGVEGAMVVVVMVVIVWSIYFVEVEIVIPKTEEFSNNFT